MNNSNVPSTHDHAGGAPALMGFVIGAAVGAGIALLFAPATGADTRKQIGQVAGRIRHRLNDSVHDARSRIGELRDDVGSAIDSGRKAFSEGRQSRATSPSPPMPE